MGKDKKMPVTLHIISEATPTRQQSEIANRERAAGNGYVFVDEKWALENDAVDCDKLVTDNKALIKKYKFD